ncbi:PAS domain-containing protein [Haematospirillum sp. H1815]|uniref:PAS domain-containing sensor histidine kinase n=1 Tax=Haematospirillum sp. H1815 TaxID=2723108 RepID=UPI001438C892|nr:ATP-binding protein [Haematospirillum sp. H1815]NKD77304.1 PAS domain-containing protein [Haematospirillum sp. H1815]
MVELTGFYIALGISTAIVLALLRRNARLYTENQKSAAEQKRMASVINIAADWVWETDRRGRITTITPSFTDITRIPVSDVIGRTRREILGRPSKNSPPGLEKAFRTRAPFSNLTFTIPTPEQQMMHISISGAPILDRHGHWKGYRGIGKNITADVAAREAVQSAEARLHIAIEGIAEGFALCQTDGTITLRNRRLRQMIEKAGGRFNSAFTLHDALSSCAENPADVRDLLDNWFTRIMRPVTFRCLNGQYYLVRLQITPDNNLLVTVGDVTEQQRAQDAEKRLEEERRQAQKLEAIGTLAGGIAHEINTPIQYIGDNVRFVAGVLPELIAIAIDVADGTNNDTSVQAATERCRKLDLGFIGPEAPLALEQALEGIEAVSRIVMAMKEFSHPSLKDPVPFDLNHNLQSTITISRNEWKLVAEVETDFENNLPPVTGLPGDLNQVFLNLIVNAAHAITDHNDTQMGKITVSTRQDGDFVEVRIADTGCGIPDDIRNKIFEPFFTTKDVGRGTGQGLAIAHDIVVRKHKGRIDIQNREGGGTIFVVRIPFDPPLSQNYGESVETFSEEGHWR